VFTSQDSSLTLTQLAQRTGLYKSTVLRLAESLIRANYLVRGVDAGYQIGPKPLQLGAIFQRQFRKAEYVLPMLHELVATSGESASFYVPSQNGRICLHRVDAPRTIRDAVREGDWRPLENGAAGIVMMAFRGDPGDEMERVRRTFWAASLGNEVDPDLAAVAVPVLDADQQLAGSLSISGPCYRLEESGTKSYVPALLGAGRRLSASFGADVAGYPIG
jgi:DNA-binding IclR family transcriptional regulator